MRSGQLIHKITVMVENERTDMLENESQLQIKEPIKIGNPLVEEFSLHGVNGYRTISLTCEKSAKIVSAENGSGKTTLLNALYAILSGKTAQLLKLNFESFTIKLSGKEKISFKKNEITPFPEDIMQIIIQQHSELIDDGDESTLFDALLQLRLGNRDAFLESEWFDRYFRTSPYDREEIERMCNDVISQFPEENNRIDEIEAYVNEILGDISVLYLPTYRRIEAELPIGLRKNNAKRNIYGRGPRGRFYRRKHLSGWEADKLIYFGLEDVQERLDDIAESIKIGTFEAYTRIGGRTLEQLLEGPKLQEGNEIDIDPANLTVMLARLGKANGEVEKRIAELISSGDINTENHSYLRNFLRQLLEVYAENQDHEQSIEKFTSVINSYWKNNEDEKRIIFDKKTVKTFVNNDYIGKNLPLNSLSSGEKQIVSIFARLYLSINKRFLVLIDEPELSLSIEWQKRFLPDILHSPSCAQLIAITHSPFVFDNQLDEFAGPLLITNEKIPS